MSETTYMLVIPPSGEIERVEMPAQNEVFPTIKRKASAVEGTSAHVTIRRARQQVDGVMLFVDEDAPQRSNADVRVNERASWLGEANMVGPAVVTGWDEREDRIPGLSLAQTVRLISMLDGAV